MSFESSQSFHLNQFEEFKYEKHVEEVVHVHKVYKFDDPLCLEELFEMICCTYTFVRAH